MKIGVTLGDAAGVGPELVLKLLAARGTADIVVYGSRRILERVAAKTGFPFPAVEISGDDFPEADAVVPGKVQACCGRMANRWFRAAAADALAGKIAAVVTAPLNKESLHASGETLPGHTEILAEVCGNAAEPCMLFWSPELVLGLVTIHTSLQSVPGLLTVDGVLQKLRLTHQTAQRIYGGPVTVGLLGLNPHAGENGLFGDEEQRILIPAMEAARAEGIETAGPLVPDTAFVRKQLPYRAYVALYHDQGLIPFKMRAFDTGVNVTVGLPVVRTSPDHGTAFDIAWQGKASAESLLSAFDLACKLA